MAKSLKLLLTESVDNLGIVGDVVSVRTGYARNYLLPRALATAPSDEMIKSLAAKRAQAEKHLAELRVAREGLVSKLQGIELQLVRSCNDLGILYGAVTQQEIAKALQAKGYDVRPRDVRIPHAIKRVDNYELHIKFEADLEAVIKLAVLPDRKLEEEKAPDLDFDAEGNLVEPGRPQREDRDSNRKSKRPSVDDLLKQALAKPETKKSEKSGGEKGDKAEKGAKADKGDKEPKAEKGEKKAKKSKE